MPQGFFIDTTEKEAEDNVFSFLTDEELGIGGEPSVFSQVAASAEAGIGDAISMAGGVLNFFSESAGESMVQYGQEIAQGAMLGITPEIDEGLGRFFDIDYWAMNAPRTIVASLPLIPAILGAGVVGGATAGALGLSAATGATAGGIAAGGLGSGLMSLGAVYNEVLAETKDHDEAFSTSMKAGVASGVINAATMGMLPKILGGAETARTFMQNFVVKAGATLSQAGGEGVDEMAQNIITGKPALQGTLDAFALGIGSEAGQVIAFDAARKMTSGLKKPIDYDTVSQLSDGASLDQAILMEAADAADPSKKSAYQNLTERDIENTEKPPRKTGARVLDEALDSRSPQDLQKDADTHGVYTADDEIKALAMQVFEGDGAALEAQATEAILEDLALDMEGYSRPSLFMDKQGAIASPLDPESKYSAEEFDRAYSGESEAMRLSPVEPGTSLSLEEQKTTEIELFKSAQSIAQLQKKQLAGEDVESVLKESLEQKTNLTQKLRSDMLTRISKVDADLSGAGTSEIKDMARDSTLRIEDAKAAIRDMPADNVLGQVLASERLMVEQMAGRSIIRKDAQNAVDLIDPGLIQDSGGNISPEKLYAIVGPRYAKSGGKLNVGGKSIYLKPTSEDEQTVTEGLKDFQDSVYAPEDPALTKSQAKFKKRIPVSPIEDGTEIDPQRIVLDLEGALDITVSQNLKGASSRLGEAHYNDLSMAIRPGNLDAMSHELGHTLQNNKSRRAMQH